MVGGNRAVLRETQDHQQVAADRKWPNQTKGFGSSFKLLEMVHLEFQKYNVVLKTSSLIRRQSALWWQGTGHIPTETQD